MEPAFKTLMLAITAIKVLTTLGAVGLLSWRLRQPIAPRHRAVYAAGALALCTATALLLVGTTSILIPIVFDGGLAVLAAACVADARLRSALRPRVTAAGTAQPSIRDAAWQEVLPVPPAHLPAPDHRA